MNRRLHRDVLAVLALLVIWGAFFYRILTPIPEHQAMFQAGDFSGQFVTFATYQYERFSSGEIPLWNPYNNGGFPFIADTQAAVFYPPRLMTIAMSNLAGHWSYHSLELEAILHVLAYTLFMYALIRRMTSDQKFSHFGAFVAALIAGYSGFTTGYPPLQLALLEAAIWLPLVILGIFEATKSPPYQISWIIFGGWALGMSWLAGHPQTSFFLTYLAIAYLLYRCWPLKRQFKSVFTNLLILGSVTFGVTAVTFIPGIEYLQYTSRAGLDYAAKSNGFPLIDVIQFFYPHVVSVWSPLYVGLISLIIVGLATTLNVRQSRWWFIVAAVSLMLSFGGNFILYPIAYTVVPGMSFFRGQERAAYLVMNSLAIITGLGIASLPALWPNVKPHFKRMFAGITVIMTLIAVAILLNILAIEFGDFSPILIKSVIIMGLSCLALWYFLQQPRARYAAFIAILLIFDLFIVGFDRPPNYDPIPPTSYPMTPPQWLNPITEDHNIPFRIDGYFGFGANNNGSLYQIADIRGISPLFIAEANQIINASYGSNWLAWELMSVRYITSPQPGYRLTETQIIGDNGDTNELIYLHRVTNPRPYAHLIYKADVVDSDAFAFALLNDPRYQPRSTIILNQTPSLTLPIQPPPDSTQSVTITNYEPESMSIEVSTPENAILSLSHMNYPGWNATINGTPTPILRAYGFLSAIEVPAGDHTISLTYQPMSFYIGAILSLVTWCAITILGLLAMMNKRRDHD